MIGSILQMCLCFCSRFCVCVFFPSLFLVVVGSVLFLFRFVLFYSVFFSSFIWLANHLLFRRRKKQIIAIVTSWRCNCYLAFLVTFNRIHTFSIDKSNNNKKQKQMANS